jgi:putative FmdB family regulatory protein
VPIYDYACSACGHVVEVIHGINDPGPHFCPNCGVEGSMRKRIVTSAVHFKGSGWAKKDRSTASASAKSKSASTAASTSSSSSTEPAAGTGAAPAKPAESATTKSGDGD